jgi:putative methyltransferase (TIGR04325 family)
MTIGSKLHKLVDIGLRLPVVRQVVQAEYHRDFIANQRQNLFLGMYTTWEEAEAAARAYGRAGYDNPDSANMYLNRIRMDEHDYPSLYWIGRSMQEGFRTVMDVGGATGIKFYAFRQELDRWRDFSWLVYDVPAMVQRGREVAAEQGVSDKLRFTDDFRAGDGVDVLLASGVLQYLPRTLPEMLQSLSALPKRIIINTCAIHQEHEYFTVNSIGTAFCPYRVQTQAALVKGLGALGYKLRTTWRNPAKPLTIPDRPAYSLTEYTGLFLEKSP